MTTFVPKYTEAPGLEKTQFSECDLLESPSYFSADLEFARRNAKGALADVLTFLGADHEFQNLVATRPQDAYVDSWVTQTRTGEIASPFGLHTDGAPKRGHQPDVDLLGRNGDSRHFLVLLGDRNGSARTRFVREYVSVDATELDKNRVWTSLHQRLYPEVQSGKVKSSELPYGVLAKYDGNTLHTAQPTTLQQGTGLAHTRLLVRVSFLTHMGPQLNTIRAQRNIPIFKG